MTPKLIAIPFGRDGNKNTIYDTRQQGQEENEATWSAGFPPVTMLRPSDGGLPPLGLDFNGIFFDISSNTSYQCMGGQYKFDVEYVNKINGYPKGAILLNNANDKQYISNIDNNKINFNTASASTLTAWSIISIIDIDKELAKKISSVDLSEALNLKADKDRQIVAGNGLTGGGTLEQNRTVTLGTPTKITATSENDVTNASHTHEIDKATLTQKGVTQLTNIIDDSEDKAATPKSVLSFVKSELDKLIPVGTTFIWDFDKPPEGYLFKKGQVFSATQYPKLAQLFPSLRLPDFRGVVPRGVDDGRGFDVNRELLSYQEDAARKITGSISAINNTAIGQNAQGAFRYSAGGNYTYHPPTADKYTSATLYFDSSYINPSAHENRMKNIATNYIIKAG